MRIGEKEAIFRLASGEVIAFTTDTICGMAAQINNKKAFKRLSSLKGRSQTKPTTIMISAPAELRDFLSKSIYLPSCFERCLDAWWPGPCTMVLPVIVKKLLQGIFSSDGYSGFRVPQHPELQSFLKKTGPLAVSSANVSGDFPSISLDEVENLFGSDFSCLEFDPNRTIGFESTIVKLYAEKLDVLREGLLSIHDIASVWQGTLSVHKSIFESKCMKGKRIYWGCPEEDQKDSLLVGFSNRRYTFKNKIFWGEDSNLKEVLSYFYPTLRQAASSSFQKIYLDGEWPKGDPIWDTLRKKLFELTNDINV